MRCYLLCIYRVLAVLVPAAIGPCRHGFRKPAAGRLAKSLEDRNGMEWTKGCPWLYHIS